jgi:hypothetical protein
MTEASITETNISEPMDIEIAPKSSNLAIASATLPPQKSPGRGRKPKFPSETRNQIGELQGVTHVSARGVPVVLRIMKPKTKATNPGPQKKSTSDSCSVETAEVCCLIELALTC